MELLNFISISKWIKSYQDMGEIVAFLLPLSEAFLPFLPLFAIVTSNAAAFGLWKGFLLTWLGASIGSILTFLIVRRLSRNWVKRLLKKYRRIDESCKWVEKHGFSMLFLLFCLPFTPSSLLNAVAGLSTLPFRTYFWAAILGKAIMVFSLSVISYDIASFTREPWKMVFFVFAIMIFWFVGKRLEKRFLVT